MLVLHPLPSLAVHSPLLLLSPNTPRNHTPYTHARQSDSPNRSIAVFHATQPSPTIRLNSTPINYINGPVRAEVPCLFALVSCFLLPVIRRHTPVFSSSSSPVLVEAIAVPVTITITIPVSIHHRSPLFTTTFIHLISSHLISSRRLTSFARRLDSTRFHVLIRFRSIRFNAVPPPPMPRERALMLMLMLMLSVTGRYTRLHAASFYHQRGPGSADPGDGEDARGDNAERRLHHVLPVVLLVSEPVVNHLTTRCPIRSIRG